MTTKDEMKALLENKSFENAEDYIRRGRRFAGTPTPELKEQWITAFKAWATDWVNEPTRKVRQDLEAEISIRDDALPLDAVKAEMAALVSAAQEAKDRLDADPNLSEQAERGLQTDLSKFAESLKTKKH